MNTLAFGYILPTTGWIRDFNPLETCAARRTPKKRRAARSPLISLLIFRLDQSVSIAFSLINNIDILCLCVDEYIEIMS